MKMTILSPDLTLTEILNQKCQKVAFMREKKAFYTNPVLKKQGLYQLLNSGFLKLITGQ